MKIVKHINNANIKNKINGKVILSIFILLNVVITIILWESEISFMAYNIDNFL